MDKLQLVYDDYMKHAVTNERFTINEREKWNELVKDKFAYMVFMNSEEEIYLFFLLSRIEVIDHGHILKYYKSENFSMILC